MTFDEANRIIVYDEVTGALAWRAPCGNRLPGQSIGTPDTHGHLRFKHAGRSYAVHRVCWLIVFGEWPREQIDHINGDRTDNRIINLRQVSARRNSENQRRAHCNNRLGVLGVRKVRNRFHARITVNGAPLFLGVFESEADAAAAYVEAKRGMHRGCTI